MTPPVCYYFDVHVPYPIVLGLRARGIDVVTAQEDGAARLSDANLLDRAGSLQRVLVTQDADLLREASLRNTSRRHFGGIIYAHPLRTTIGQIVSDLYLISTLTTIDEWFNRLEHLPL